MVEALYMGLLGRSAEEAALVHYSGEIVGGRGLEEVFAEVFASQEYQQKTPVPLFVPPGHFYSPVVHPAEAEAVVAKLETTAWPRSLPGVAIDFDALRAHWATLLPHILSTVFEAEKGERRYGFNNPAFSWGDGLMLQAMIRQHRPRRIIEIGSGWSSACMLDTVEEFLDGTDLTFIDPYPGLLLELIGPSSGATVIDKKVQDVDLAVFDALEAGDILFIDSSHVVKTGSDCCYEFFDIVPRLKPGVIVHVHDIIWPFEYPRWWSVKENRSWNEVYLVRALLWQSDAFEVLAFNDYMGKVAPEETRADAPDFMKNSGGSIWMRKRV